MSGGDGYHGRDGSALGEAPDSLTHFPASIKDEQALICALIIHPEEIPAISERLKAAHFFRDAHQIIYLAIVDLYHRAVAPTVPALAQELDSRNQFAKIGGDDYLFDISQVNPTGNNAEFHAAVVYDKWRKRTLLAELQEGERRLLANGQTTDQLLTGVLAGLADMEEAAEDDTAFLDTFQPWPGPLADDAFYGIAGDIVRLIEPHTESDPAAILFQFLAAFGNMIGRGPHWRVEATSHHLNLFVAIVGRSSKARKGTSFDHIRWICERLDPDWVASRFTHGYTSGEGLIADVCDDMTSGGAITPGVADKRLFWTESEFGGTLTIMNRDGNTLSSVMRQAWDGQTLAGRSKNRPLRATGAHISAVGHITAVEANDLLTTVNAGNGFGNRWLWVCVERSKLLPHGGQIHKVNWTPLLSELGDVIDFLKLLDPNVPIMRHRDANVIWEAVYPVLSEGKPGMLGAVTSRAEAQVMRLASLYAVLDKSNYVRAEHLNAALACWKRCEDSARYVFGERLGDPDSEKVLKALQAAGEKGLSRTQINRAAFSGRGTDAVDRALGNLLRSSLIEQVPDAKDSRGRAVSLWRCKQASPLKLIEGARSVRSSILSTEIQPWKPF